jgi:hypothetical protein
MYDTSCVIPIIKSPKDYQAYRKSTCDSNRLSIIFDSASANTAGKMPALQEFHNSCFFAIFFIIVKKDFANQL